MEKEISINKTEKLYKYRDWDILEELPIGWIIDKTAGSPVAKTVFITNGKSVLNGQKRALLKVESKRDINISKNEIAKQNHIVETNKMAEKTEIQIFPAKTVNDLARLKFKEQLLKEIMFDLMVCEIEKWDKKEYINELKKMLNSIDTSNGKKNKDMDKREGRIGVVRLWTAEYNIQ
jgi:hypothetical protein